MPQITLIELYEIIKDETDFSKIKEIALKYNYEILIDGDNYFIHYINNND